jgi:hypothetical protein
MDGVARADVPCNACIKPVKRKNPKPSSQPPLEMPTLFFFVFERGWLRPVQSIWSNLKQYSGCAVHLCLSQIYQWILTEISEFGNF